MKTALHYHNGIDYAASWLDFASRAESVPYQFVLELELASVPDENTIRRAASEILSFFPLIHSRRARNMLNIAPYQRIIPTDKTIPFDVSEAKDENTYDEHIRTFLNSEISGDFRLALRLIKNTDGTSSLLFKFDHKVFDGAGAEIIVDTFCRLTHIEKPDESFKQKPEGPWLNEWKTQFMAGRTFNRHKIASKKHGIPGVFTEEGESAGKADFITLRLGRDEKKAIEAQSDEIAGPMMMSVFIVAKFGLAVSELLREKGAASDCCAIPVTIDLRRGQPTPVMMNHWAPVTFFMPSGIKTIKEATDELKRQFCEIMRIGYPECIEKVNLLTRPLPLKIASKFFTSNIFRASTGTAVCGLAWQGHLASKSIAGAEIRNLVHIPVVPPKPGIGLFSNISGENINFVASFRTGVIERNDARYILDGITRKTE